MPNNFENNFSDLHLNLIQPNGTTSGEFNPDAGDFIRIVIGNKTYYSSKVISDGDNYGELTTEGLGDFPIFKDVDGNFYIKPNDLLDDEQFPEGNYTVRIDYLNQLNDLNNQNINFIVREVSPSGLETRLKLKEGNISKTHDIHNVLKNNLGDAGEDAFNFNFVLDANIAQSGEGSNIPIVNYVLDDVTNGENNQSVILKLYRQTPFSQFSEVAIYKEILLTQVENIQYFSDVITVPSGTSLTIDDSYDTSDFSDEAASENYNDLTGSAEFDLSLIDSLKSGSDFDYPNLNIDYSDFGNHIFFGSATKKLENFKTKLGTIQGYYNQISMSLSGSGVGGGSSTRKADEDTDGIVTIRETYFKKIEDKVKTFTPYEKFLYYDGQNYSSASAPGVGQNYTNNYALNPASSSFIEKSDGFQGVYYVSSSGNETWVIKDDYRIEDKPFYSYSGSLYLSFLCKADTFWNGSSDTAEILHSHNLELSDGDTGYYSPKASHGTSSLANPTFNSSSWLRAVYKTSASYWAPNDSIGYDASQISYISDNEIDILSGSIKTGSAKIYAPGDYQNIATYITQSGNPFSGSILPTGNIFRLHWDAANTLSIAGAVSASYFADIKITKNDPSDTLPFAQVYSTGSSTFTSWYSGIYDSASAWDERNIHSFENNLPTYIKDSDENNDLKTFLNMTGEQYDLIRTHIDNFNKLYSRKYNKLESVPDNLLPILAENLGWKVIKPFKGSSLYEYFKGNTSGISDINTVVNNTWRKTLNNLIYLYKTKGTEKSIRGLLNIYGYPPNVLKISELGGSTEDHNPVLVKDDFSQQYRINQQKGNISNVTNLKKLPHYIVNNEEDRILKTKWWTENANINTIEFIYKHKNTTTTQELLLSSGSGNSNSTAEIQFVSSQSGDYDGKTLILSSSDGTGKTYIFDDDSDGASGTTDSDGFVRVQLNGLSDVRDFVTQLSSSIKHANGHAGKIDPVNDDQYFSASNAAFYTNTSQAFVVSSHGILYLTQATGGFDGNQPVITNAPSASVIGFNGGGDAQKLWDLRLNRSSDGISSSFEFRLNNSFTGSKSTFSMSIAENVYSMSTDYVTMTEGSLWNVMLQRMSSSVSGSGTNEYRLATAYQVEDEISIISATSMSISGGLNRDSQSNANENWISTGSRFLASSSNLLVGRTTSGSITEFRGWSTALSASKFKQHVLNKLSTVGNNINAHTDELIYHHKFNENYTSASITASNQTTLTIIDSNPNGNEEYGDYSFSVPSSAANSTTLYGFDLINIYTFSTRTGGVGQKNSNKININPNQTFLSNLNPNLPSTQLQEEKSSQARRFNSNQLELSQTPSKFIDDFIIDKLSDFDISQLYSHPKYRYSASYSDMDEFRKNFFKNYNIKIDNNKFIRGHENIFNSSIVDAIKGILPARATLAVGVMIRPHILERQKIKSHKFSIEHGSPGINGLSSSISIVPQHLNISQSSVEKPLTSSISINIPNISQSSVETPHSSSLDIGSVITIDSMSYEPPYSSSLDMGSVITIDSMSYEHPHSSSLDITDVVTLDSMSYEPPYSSSLDLNRHITIDSMSYEHPYTSSINVLIPMIDSMSYQHPYTGSIENILPNQSMSRELSNDIQIPFFEDIEEEGNTSFTFAGKNAETQFTFPNSGSIRATITLESTDGTSINYQSRATSSAYNGGASGSRAAVLFRFTNSASEGSIITLISHDGTDTSTQKTYKAYATGAAANGTLDDDGFVVFSTGSGRLSDGNATATSSNHFMASITSSNGHGTKLSVSGSEIGALVYISQSNPGILGNTNIAYTASYNQFGTGSDNFTDFLHPAFVPTTFTGGDNDTTYILFSTGSSGDTVAGNFLAAVTSSLGHVDRFNVSKPTPNSVKLVQRGVGIGGNTTITSTKGNWGGPSSFNTLAYRTFNVRDKFGDDNPGTFTFRFFTTASDGSTITLKSFNNDDTFTTKTYLATGSNITNGKLNEDSSSVLFRTGSTSSTSATALIAAITSSNGHGGPNGTIFSVFQVNGTVFIHQSTPGSKGNTEVTTADGFITSTNPNPDSFFVSGSGIVDGTDNDNVKIDKTILKVISKDMSYEHPHTSSIDINKLMTRKMSLESEYTSSISTLAILTSSIVYPVSGTTDDFNTIHTSEFENLHKDWGTNNDSTHFIHNGESGSNLDYNTGHIDDRFHFYMIGDVEVFSGSRNDEGIVHTDFTDIRNFHNRQITNKGEEYRYESFIGGAIKIKAAASFTFIESASNHSEITLISTDGTSKTYVAQSGSVNGSLSGSLVVFSTGSLNTNQSSSAAGNFLAAITSSNGHSTKFNVSQGTLTTTSASGLITLEQSGTGQNGNRAITYDVLPQNFLINRSSSFTGGTDDDNGMQDGKAMGKTRYFSASADGGTLFYPSNHVTRFANDFSDKHWKGTQNTNPGFLNLKNYEDYSSASFYRAKVSGDNVLRPNYGKYILTPSASIERMV